MNRFRFSLMAVILATVFLPALVGAQRATRSPWPKKDGVYLATSSETIPQFPGALSGYRSTGDLDYWDNHLPFSLHGSVRIFQGNGWQGISDDFPKTMNHCSAGKFMMRWRSDNPNVLVSTALAWESDILEPPTQTGRFGYMRGWNCVEPVFKFARAINGNKSTLVDIYYELKFWRAAP